jgi:DNA (cytosine-5)-methyltransferase 1
MSLLPEKILSGQVEAPDLFCGGTPCQAFSVAGLRNSLDDARGNLSLTFVGIANAIDHVRSLRGDSPAIVFWENVPGVLNTKDNAFGCFLGALAGESEPITAPGERWSNAGCVFGPQRTVAWRVLDAQYFGVAQRRRRVFVVASARDDINPTEVLFEFEGLRRDTAPSRQARKVTPTISSSGTGVSRVGFNCEDEWFIETPVVGALDTECGGNKMNHQTINSGHLLPVSSFYESSLAQYREANVSGTIKASGGVAGGGSETFLAQPIPLNTMNLLGREVENTQRGFGVGKPGDPSPTLTKSHSHAVAQPIAFTTEQTPKFNNNQALTLTKSESKHNQCVAQPIAYNITFCDANGRRSDRPNGGLYVNETDVTSTLTKAGIGTNVAQPVAFNIAPEKGELKHDIHVTDAHISKTIDASGSNPSMHQGGAAIVQPIPFDTTQITSKANYSKPQQGDPCHPLAAGAHPPAIAQTMAVRRLTPVECERLQGFPDGYTNIPWRKAAESPDGPRYKALGNSWAVPVVAWLGQRIKDQLQ